MRLPFVRVLLASCSCSTTGAQRQDEECTQQPHHEQRSPSLEVTYSGHVHLPFSSLLSKGESLKRRSTESWLLHREHTPLWGQAYHSNRLSLVLLGRCLRVANFVELRYGEVRRIHLLRTPMNTGKRV